jgi:hypothetical protein
MKIIVSALALILLTIGCASDLRKRRIVEDTPPPLYAKAYCTNQKLTREAIIYYRKLLAQLLPTRNAGYDYLLSVTTLQKVKPVEKKRQNLLKAIKQNRKFCISRKPIQGDSTLKSDLIRYLDFEYLILKNDFDKIAEMEDSALQSNDQILAHQRALDLIAKKLNGWFGTLKRAEIEFFNRYEITEDLKNDEFRQRIEKADKAIRYYNVLNRILSEAINEDYYARQAVDKNDTIGIIRHTRRLAYLAEQGLRQLEQKNGYEGDCGLILATEDLLEFYQHDGQVTFPANIEFLNNSNDFQKESKKFNSIKESDRKQADIDDYNNAVKLHDKEAGEINRINAESLQMNRKLLDLWSDQAGIFLRKYAADGRL